MFTIEIDDLQVEVSEFFSLTNTSIPRRRARFRGNSPDFDPPLAAEVSIAFRDGNSWH
jgi:hypothetical protein